ncbi:MAG: aldo/keto reductase [Candidatus Kariarchaeaceae archaeon]|jgi:aryl-alcohol dehydrogenase-like predicted oxidoreductase
MNKIKIKGLNKSTAQLGMGCFGLGGTFYGTNGFPYAYGDVDDQESIRAIHKAIDLGINLFDTADIYGLGRSEKVLGTAIKDYRDDIIIATKFGSMFDEETQKTLDGKGTSKEYILSAIDSSMRRLQTDFIDIYQFHSSSHEIEESKGVKEVLDDLVSEGRIGGYGWSTDDVERMEFFAESEKCNSVQFALNVVFHNPEMVELCDNKQLAGLIRSPLASGTLTGKYRKGVKIAENHMLSQVDFSSERRELITEKLDILKDLLTHDGRSLIQGQLSWIMSQGNRIIPIPGAKSVQQITENAQTLEFGPLKQSTINDIKDLFANVTKNTYIKA